MTSDLERFCDWGERTRQEVPAEGAETLFLPSQVLQEYVRLVEDVETRLNLATKYKCHDVVIEVGPCCVCEEMGQEPAFSP